MDRGWVLISYPLHLKSAKCESAIKKPRSINSKDGEANLPESSKIFVPEKDFRAKGSKKYGQDGRAACFDEH